MEEELRESEARFRSLTELSSDWYWKQDENLRFTYLPDGANSGDPSPAEGSIGKTREELGNKSTPVSLSWVEHEAVLAARQPFHDFEYSRLDPDGINRYVSVSGAPIFDEDGRFKGYHGVGRNITERKLAEAALRESEARFRRLTKLSSDWYWKQDENLRFTHTWSEVENHGYTGDSSIGKTRWELAGIIKLLNGTWAEHKAVLAARQPFRDLEYCRTGPDGVVRYISISGVPVFDEEGRFKGYEGVGLNITERKRIEQDLRDRQEILDVAQKAARAVAFEWGDRKSTRLNSSHTVISYAVFCLQKKKSRFSCSNWIGDGGCCAYWFGFVSLADVIIRSYPRPNDLIEESTSLRAGVAVG